MQEPAIATTTKDMASAVVTSLVKQTTNSRALSFDGDPVVHNIVRVILTLSVLGLVGWVLFCLHKRRLVCCFGCEETRPNSMREEVKTGSDGQRNQQQEDI